MSNDKKRDYLVLAEELLRRKKEDPLLLYKPHAKQVLFIDSVMKEHASENWAFWANRAGKTDAGCYCDASLARFKGESGWVVSLDFPASRDITQPKLFDNGHVPPDTAHPPFIPDREIDEWRISDQILKLKNGAIIGFKSCDSGRKKFQGAEKSWIHFDEEPPEEIYEECIIRVGAKKRLKIYGTCTLLPPEGEAGGVAWAFAKIIQRVKDGELKGVNLFEASIYDNPHLMASEVRRLEAKWPPTSIVGRIRLGGEWLPGLSGALAYPSFDRLLHVGEQPEIQRRLPLIWCWDFNVDPMVSLVGQKIDGVFHIYKEFFLQPGTIPEMVRAFRENFPTHGASIQVYGDAAGSSRTSQTGVTDYRVLLNEMRTYDAPVELNVPTKNPVISDRLNAVNRQLKNEFGEVCVSVDPECKELIQDFELVLRDNKGGLKKVYNKKNSYFNRTHLSDAFGYWIFLDSPIGELPRGNIIEVPKIITPNYSFRGRGRGRR